MLERLTDLLEGAMNIGVKDGMPLFLRDKVKILNQLSIIVMFFASLALISLLLAGLWVNFSIVSVYFFIALTTLFALHKGNFKLAIVISLFCSTLFLASLSVIYGPDLGVEPGFIILVVFMSLMFDEPKVRLQSIFYVIVVYLISRYLQLQIDPILSIKNGKDLYFFAAIFACSIVIARLLDRKNYYLIENNKLLESVKKKNTSLERSNDALKSFAHITSHDLKSPLRNIISFIGLAKKQIKPEDDKTILEYINFAQTNAYQMNDLIEDILKFSVLKDEDIEYQEIDLNNIANAAKDNLSNIIQEKNAKVILSELPIIKGNKSQLILLFQNLLENGIKYNTSKEPIIKISGRIENNINIIVFADNGIGFEKIYEAQIFEMFKRLHTTSSYTGTGIGLAICKKIVEAHQGTIKVSSKIGKGSIFTVELP